MGGSGAAATGRGVEAGASYRLNYITTTLELGALLAATFGRPYRRVLR
jgi:hypothetical protein